jgi:pyruvate formate lyase activating enzyme
MVKGNIHSIETFGSVDGPGIRFVIFLQGCHMRCRFCHNPDSWSTAENNAMTADELLDKAERYRDYWGDEGGITVSGGEPLLQLDFLLELFSKAKQRGINTCLDTSAQPFTRGEDWFCRFEELMKLTDTILLDIKHIRNDRHKWLTGWGNSNILDCAKYLSDIRKPVWIRHVLVPGITDDDTCLRELSAFLSTLGNVRRIDVLPYHTMGVYKYERLGIRYTLADVCPPTEQRVKAARALLSCRQEESCSETPME